MPSFNEFIDSQAVANRFSDQVVVYVEGESDVEILTRIFRHKIGLVEFRPPVDGAGGGGCEAVRSRVLVERKKNEKIFGIIDGDIYFRYRAWAKFYETEKTEETKEEYSADGIIVLERWELENYVCEPKAVFRLIQNWCSFSGSYESALEKLLSICRMLLPLSAASAHFHDHGIALEVDQRFCNETNVEGIERKVSKFVADKVSNCKEDAIGFEAHYASVKQFDVLDGTLDQRYDLIVRIVDGKRLISWMMHKFKIQQNPILQLADNVHACQIESELHEFIQEIC